MLSIHLCIRNVKKYVYIFESSTVYAKYFIRHTQQDLFPSIWNICLISKHTVNVSAVPDVIDVSNRL